ncbi:hypothetical protein TNCV_3866521 [Trichonephila clavipes]|nr:hypothetical protein TNCV_3866521 [Trichonephila clavipes]
MTPVVSRSFEHHTGDGTIWLGSSTNLEEEHSEGGQEASHLSTSSTNPTRGHAAQRLCRVPPCRKGTIHLQTSMTSPRFEPSPCGTTVIIANLVL